MSNKHEALAIHYSTEHPSIVPDLKYSILTVEPNTVRRKIFEALVISNLNPSLNLKEELKRYKDSSAIEAGYDMYSIPTLYILYFRM